MPVTTLKDRLAEVMAAKNWEHADLVRVSGQSSSVVSQWCGKGSKEIKSIGKMEAAEAIERESGYAALWIAKGLGPKHVAAKASSAKVDADAKSQPPNISQVPQLRFVPLISWVQAGELNGVIDLYHPGDASTWVPAVTSSPGPRAFALTVVGDSMTNPNPSGDSFPEGTTLIVDPDIAPTPGKYVIAKDVDTQEATFKKLMSDGGSWYLRPLNPAYPTKVIDKPTLRVVGVVVEMLISRKV